MTTDRRKLHERIAGTFGWTVERGVAVVLGNGEKTFLDRWTSPQRTASWDAPNFDTDETANAMLLEAMPMGSLCYRRMGDGTMIWECTPNWEMGFGGDPLLVRNSSRKRAIVDAYAKWKGLDK